MISPGIVDRSVCSASFVFHILESVLVRTRSQPPGQGGGNAKPESGVERYEVLKQSVITRLRHACVSRTDGRKGFFAPQPLGGGGVGGSKY